MVDFLKFCCVAYNSITFLACLDFVNDNFSIMFPRQGIFYPFWKSHFTPLKGHCPLYVKKQNKLKFKPLFHDVRQIYIEGSFPHIGVYIWKQLIIKGMLKSYVPIATEECFAAISLFLMATPLFLMTLFHRNSCQWSRQFNAPFWEN